jgi:hypothetical protein
MFCISSIEDEDVLLPPLSNPSLLHLKQSPMRGISSVKSKSMTPLFGDCSPSSLTLTTSMLLLSLSLSLLLLSLLSRKSLTQPSPSFIDSARKKLFVSSPKKTARQEPFRIDWLDYDTIKNKANKYTTGTNGSQEKSKNILSLLLNQFTPTQIKLALAVTLSKLGQSAPSSCNNFSNGKKDLIKSFMNLIYDRLSIIGSDKKNQYR